MAKVLIISTWNGFSVLAHLRQVKKYKNIKELEFWNPIPDQFPCPQLQKALEEKARLWFFVNEGFAERFTWAPMVNRMYKDQVVNGDLTRLRRYDMHTIWREAGFFVPQQARNPVTLHDLPFGPPWIVRRNFGHSGTSRQTLIQSENDLQIWRDTFDFEDYVVEEFIDVSQNSICHTGRIIQIGEKLLPKNAAFTNNWFCHPPNSRGASNHRVVEGLDCLESLPYEVDMGQVKSLFNVQGNDIAAIDFSFQDGKLIPWEINFPFGFFSRASTISEETINFQLEFLNSILSYFEIDVELTYSEVEEIYTEFFEYKAPWRAKGFYKSWEGLCPIEELP